MIERFCFRYWWVCAYGFLCYFVYTFAEISIEEQRLELQNQQMALLQSTFYEKAKHEDLSLQINSQSDPAWVELTLMNGLGLVPEEQTKVYFQR